MELYTQIAALPYIFIKDEIKVCLITTRETKRLVIPKGWPKIGVPSYEMAAIEAKEEAGLIGSIDKKSIGTYNYKKRLHIFARITCEVKIYPLKVDQQLIDFPEKTQRTLHWLTIKEAAEKVSEADFAKLLLSLEHNPNGVIRVSDKLCVR